MLRQYILGQLCVSRSSRNSAIQFLGTERLPLGSLKQDDRVAQPSPGL
jgi:hypothetical protein